MTSHVTTQSFISDLLLSAGAADPFVAVRMKANEAIERYRSAFGEPTMPLDVDALTSLLGIEMSDDAPAHSKDAELIPTGNGRVSMRVNRNQPETRRRFSVGHEVSHTFFPNYQTKPWCRTDGKYRRRDNPDDLVEMLCDAGSAELVLPVPWFNYDAARVTTGADLLDLSDKYVVSREATLRRFAELHPRCVSAVFFSWKLKPTQKLTIGDVNQPDLFEANINDRVRRAKKLRIDYSISSHEFGRAGYYIPHDKSVANQGPLYEAASLGLPREGECALDLGPVRGRFAVLAIPLWTAEEDSGPEGEAGVAAILEPLDLKLPYPWGS